MWRLTKAKSEIKGNTEKLDEIEVAVQGLVWE